MTPSASIDRDELVAYLDRLLQAQEGSDDCPNGLQVEGRPRVRRLVTGVSACRELFERAAALDADAVLVHHGIFWNGDPRSLTGLRYRRVAELVRSGLNLLAYHLPLDRHPDLGNNARAATALGLGELEAFGHYEGGPLGYRGRYAEPLSLEGVLERCRQVFGQQPDPVFRYGPDPLSTLGIVSGAAERLLFEAIDRRLDAYITGEASEWVMNVAREAEIHFIAVGHYASERLGVQALGEHLEQRFQIEVRFVDVPNPV